ncbi:MAG: T9SS type A sorting domain-containing protein [Ferruginibacter sp.]|nr:T9SS type A sorting domain-containing protein [Cytophagales bacterium]
MKQLKMTLASLFMVLSFQGFANDCEDDNAAGAKAEMSIEKSDKDAVYRLIYLSTSEGIVSVSIYDERGTLLLTDRIRNVAGGFARPYNFSGLPSGEYTIQITDASGKTTKTLQYGEASSSETAGRQSELKVNVNALAESTRYELSVLGDRAQPVTVTIYDAQNNRIFSEQIDEPGNFRKVYDLSKVRASGGAFEVTHAGSVFQQPIR